MVGDYAVIGAHNHIGPGAVVKRDIVWDGANIAAGAALKGGILGQKAQLEERAVVYEGAVMADKSILGTGSVVRPGVKVWPYKHVESGIKLHSNLVWGSRACRFLFGFDGVKGRLNGECSVEAAASLGAAFGSMLGRGKRVVVGHAGAAAASFLKDAVRLGLISTGLEVYELGEIPVPSPVLPWTYTGPRGDLPLCAGGSKRQRLLAVFRRGGNEPLPQ